MNPRSVKATRRAAPAVPYKVCRGHFRSGDLIAQSHGDWSSWVAIQTLSVRVFTGSTYSHVGVIEVDKSDGHVYVVEAVRPRSQRVRLSAIGSFYHLDLGRFARWSARTRFFAELCVGRLYSRWDAVRAYFWPLPAGTVSQCAALVREVLQRAGVNLGPKSRPDAVVQSALAMGCTLTFVKNDDASNAGSCRHA